MAIVSSTVGSPTVTGWKHRSSAGSFSMCLRYSVERRRTDATELGRASIGLSMLPASTEPSAAPGPTIVCSSSMKIMISPRASVISLSTAFTNPPIPRGTWSRRPSARCRADELAVTQALGRVTGDDPLGETFNDRGLADARLADQHRVVLCGRESTWTTRRFSSSRPITGSSLFCAAASVRSRPKRSTPETSSGF